jgi:hypothetical protein
MIYAFDTLGYAKRLRDAGVSQEHAEAHAEAAREFVMGELVTRYDLEMATTLIRRDFEVSIGALRHDVEKSIGSLRLDFEKSVATFRKDMETSMEAFRRDMDRLVLRLTLRLGGMSAVSVAIFAAIVKL